MYKVRFVIINNTKYKRHCILFYIVKFGLKGDAEYPQDELFSCCYCIDEILVIQWVLIEAQIWTIVVIFVRLLRINIGGNAQTIVEY